MSGFEIDRRSYSSIESLFPSGHANAPAVARFKPGKAPGRMWCDQIVAHQHRVIEKLTGYLGADCMQSGIFRSSPAITIAIKPGQRISATTLQIRPEHVCWHGEF